MGRKFTVVWPRTIRSMSLTVHFSSYQSLLHAWAAVGLCTVLQAGSRGFDPRWRYWKFYWHNLSGRTMAMGSAQTLTEMRTRKIFWGDKGGRRAGQTTLPSSWPNCRGIWEPQPLETWGPVQGLVYIWVRKEGLWTKTARIWGCYPNAVCLTF